MQVRFFKASCWTLMVGLTLVAASSAHNTVGSQDTPNVQSGQAPGANESRLKLEWHQLPSLPDSPGVASPFSGMSDETLIVAGGANFPDAPPWKNGTKVWHDTIYGFVDQQWKILGRLPSACAYGVSFQTVDGLICAGGSDASSHSSRVFRLQWKSQRLIFSELPPLPQPIANACGAVLENTLFLAGGTNHPTATEALSKFYSLDMKAVPMAWKELPDIPREGRMLSVASAASDAFYLFSGAQLSSGPDGNPIRRYLKDAWRYDIQKNRWHRLADLPNAVVAAPSPAPAFGDRQILVLGGDDGANAGFQPLEDHPGFAQHSLIYSAESDTWSVLPRLQVSRVTVPIVKTDKSFILTSGELRPGVRSPEIWEMKISP